MQKFDFLYAYVYVFRSLCIIRLYMKKLIIISTFIFCLPLFIQSSEHENIFVKKAILQKITTDSCSLVFILPEHILNLPLAFTNRHKNDSLDFLQFLGFQFSDGSIIYYPPEENPHKKKIISYPKNSIDVLNLTEAMPIELFGVHFKTTE